MILIISSIFSFGIINFVILDPKTLFLLAASVTDAAAVNPNGIKTILGNGLSTCFIKCKPAFSNGPKCLPKNPPDCPILCNWAFDDCILGN